MKKILVPTDFSEYSDCGISSAATLAQKDGSELILFHVASNEEESADAEKKFESIDHSDVLKGLSHDKRFVVGDIVESIVNENADLIVLGSREMSGLKGFFTRSISEKVAKSAHCPVIVVRHHVDLANIKNIVYPTDMRGEQTNILPELKTLQKSHHAQLHLLKVFDDGIVMRRDVETRLRDFAQFHDLSNYTITARPNINEGEEIVLFAEELGADLIAMATHDRHGLEKLIGGYISSEVLKESKVPIWTKVID